MARKIIILASILLLGACSLSCSDRFENANNHILDTAQSVYELRSLGKVTAEGAFQYQMQIENAYKATHDGNAQCESDEAVAQESFEKAEDILEVIDSELSINETLEISEIEGK